MDTLTRVDRALATVETIADLHDIPGADAIVCARVRGWDVVVRRDEFEVGDRVIYIEVDSMLDTEDPRFAFLAPRGVRTDDQGRSGHVVKTARLRGQYSQGIVFGFSEFPEHSEAAVGTDLTAELNIVKWDPPLPAELAGSARGYLPTWIHESSESRIQNLAEILTAGDDGNWVATEKIDGSSMTVYVDGEDFGVASRTVDLVETAGNKMWIMARKLGLHEMLRQAFPGQSAVVQGEIYGPGIGQKNPLQVADVAFAAFTVQVDGRVLPRSEWPAAFLAIAVPVYQDLPYPKTVDEAVEQVDGIMSLVNPARVAEGIVWRNEESATVEVNGQVVLASWKISRRYLLKADR